jgi:large subunit ribosomal protein L33
MKFPWLIICFFSRKFANHKILIARNLNFDIVNILMARETIILECTEARKEGKQPSRYMASRNKKLQSDPVEKKKYNRFLRRHTMHKEIKS